jgi:hypothetical protein
VGGRRKKLAGPAGLVCKLVELVEWFWIEIGLTHKLVGLIDRMRKASSGFN